VLLSITNTSPQATDLGYLLHKHPDRVHRFDLPFGQATVFYPEASDERCTASLHVQVDPLDLVRGRKGGEPSFPLEQYVNDRPYAATSFLSVAIARVYGTALAGRCTQRPDLPERALPLEARIAALPSRGGPSVLRRLFAPLGYEVEIACRPLDDSFPEWGESPYQEVCISARARLQDLLSHLYVLIPVLDDHKHYWVGEAEVEKLFRHGSGWLPGHPERAFIAQRYLRHHRSLVDEALSRLLTEEMSDPDEARAIRDREEEAVERPLRLNEIRLQTVAAALKSVGAKRILDLGCGEGRLIRLLAADGSFEEITGVDVSHRALETARLRLDRERIPDRIRQRIRLLHGSLTYRDRRLEGYDAAALVEVVEHLDPSRLEAFERAVFETAKPRRVILTTPNHEYNARFGPLPAARFRHRDHRFEWSRKEFQGWAAGVADRFGYEVRFEPVGPEDPELGPATQMGVFRR
jgi:3' terminal RNA ribose 2'-O-methyltransferase Hen1